MLPALCCVVVYFGYIARMTRAGTIQALDADYTRTAVMKGLGRRQVMRRHVARNALQPTVSVIGVQIGYLFAGLIADRADLQLPRPRQPDLQRVDEEGLPAAVGGGDHGRDHLHALHAGRRPRHRLDEPAGPHGGVTSEHDAGHSRLPNLRRSRPSSTSAAEAAAFEELGAEVDAGRAPLDSRLEKRQARRERLRLLIRRPGFIIGTVILVWWIVCAIGGDAITPYNPITSFSTPSQPPSAEHWMGTDALGRDVLSRVMAGARDVLIAAPIAAVIGVTLGTMVGLLMGYYRGWVDEVTSRLVEALLSIPLILVALLVVTSLGSSRATVIGTVAILFIPIVARTVRAAVLAESQLDYVTSARLRGESGAFVMTREILPNITRRRRRRAHGAHRLRRVHDRHAVVPRRRHPAAVARLGADDQGELPVHPGRAVVADVVPGAGHRQPGDRHQPGGRLDRRRPRRLGAP